MLDFARGRLGGGLKLDLNAEAPLRAGAGAGRRGAALRLAGAGDRAALVIDQPVNCDRARIAQLLSNLLANALTHGAPDAPVRVSASSDGDVFELSVENKGGRSRPAPSIASSSRSSAAPRRTGQQGLASASISPPRSPAHMAAR